MNLPRAPLGTFLSAAKAVLTNSNVTLTANRETTHLPNNFTFVVGNESADLDSIISAIVLAYFLTYFPIYKPAVFHIPLSNIPQSSLRLRPELVSVLKYAGLVPSDILTLSNLPTPLPPPEETRWLLVDHNKLTGILAESYGDRMIGYIDHHEREQHSDGKGGTLKLEPQVIEKASSCASLVVAWIREHWLSAMQLPAHKHPQQASIKDKKADKWEKHDAQLARLALAPILIDSRCLRSFTTEPKDIYTVEFLEKFIMKYEGAAYNRKDFYNEISTAKHNLDSLTLIDIFRKDYKQWTEESPVLEGSILSQSKIGIISVVKPIEYLLQRVDSKADFLQTLLTFAQEHKLSLIAIMTSFESNGRYKRELLVWGLDERGIQASQWFEDESSVTLNLEKWVYGDISFDLDDNQVEKVEDFNTSVGWRRCWVQHNTNSSRKQVAPLLRTALRRTFSVQS